MDLIRNLCPLALICAGGLWAQSDVMPHNFEIDAAGLFPLSGFRTYQYSPGPAWRPGYEYRFSKLLGFETGLTQAWLPGLECTGSGCKDLTKTLKLLDYGLRAHAMLAGGRLDVSAGLGGGYVWHGANDSLGNDHLLQYSAKAAVALDRDRRFRLAFTFRAWRDPGRPTQQWATTSGGLIVALGGR